MTSVRDEISSAMPVDGSTTVLECGQVSLIYHVVVGIFILRVDKANAWCTRHAHDLEIVRDFAHANLSDLTRT